MNMNHTQIKVTTEEIEIARFAIEYELITRREERISTMENAGLCAKEFNGTPSSAIRMSIAEAIVTAIRVINSSRLENESKS